MLWAKINKVSDPEKDFLVGDEIPIASQKTNEGYAIRMDVLKRHLSRIHPRMPGDMREGLLIALNHGMTVSDVSSANITLCDEARCVELDKWFQ